MIINSTKENKVCVEREKLESFARSLSSADDDDDDDGGDVMLKPLFNPGKYNLKRQ